MILVVSPEVQLASALSTIALASSCVGDLGALLHPASATAAPATINAKRIRLDICALLQGPRQAGPLFLTQAGGAHARPTSIHAPPKMPTKRSWAQSLGKSIHLAEAKRIWRNRSKRHPLPRHLRLPKLRLGILRRALPADLLLHLADERVDAGADLIDRGVLPQSTLSVSALGAYLSTPLPDTSETDACAVTSASSPLDFTR